MMKTAKRYLINAITMFLVSWLSLMLLVYVGYGEAQRTYHQFQSDQLLGHGKIVLSSMEAILQAGLPMKQFVGFNTLVEPILASDKSIVSFIAVNEACCLSITAPPGSQAALPLSSTITRFCVGIINFGNAKNVQAAIKLGMII